MENYANNPPPGRGASNSVHLTHSSSHSDGTVFSSVSVPQLYENKHLVNIYTLTFTLTHTQTCGGAETGKKIAQLNAAKEKTISEKNTHIDAHTWKMVSMNIFCSHHLFWPSWIDCPAKPICSYFISSKSILLLGWTDQCVCVFLYMCVYYTQWRSMCRASEYEVINHIIRP